MPFATIAANARSMATAASTPFLGRPTVAAVINNGAAAGAKCCPGAAWSCSTSAGFTTCADGSTPGTYLTVTAQYPFLALFPGDIYLVGKTLNESVVAALQ